MNRIPPILYGLLALAIAFALFVIRDGMGFPDGHLTELDLAAKPLLNTCIGLYLVLGLSFIIANWSKKMKKSTLGTLHYSFILSVLVAIGIYYSMTLYLDDGIGG